MNSVIRLVSLVALIGVIALTAFGQTLAPAGAAPQLPTVASILPTVETSDLPGQIYAFGVGVSKADAYKPTGWASGCQHATGVMYACVRTDYQPGLTTVTAGTEAIFYRNEWLAVTLKANVGEGTGAGGTGGSYGAGGSIVVNPEKLGIKSSGWQVVLSGTVDKSNVAQFVNDSQSKGVPAGLRALGATTQFRIGLLRART
jgi:hypothetical protein